MDSKNEIYHLDTILDGLGNFGKFQLMNYVLICLSIAFNAIFTVSYVFTAGNVDYRCAVPECDSEHPKYIEPWSNFTVPFDRGVPLRNCERYMPISFNDTNDEFKENITECDTSRFDPTSTMKCDQFVYKDDEITIANEWNILCPENEWKLTLIGSINNIGQFVGMPIGGFISDRYGRRTALIFTGMASAVMGLVRSFSFNYSMFVAFEFLDAALGSALYSAAMILGVEFVGPDKRVLACSILASSYAVGEVILGLTAMYIQNWKILLRVLYAPALVHMAYYWLLPESVRWLLTQGRRREAVNVLKKAAKMNNIELSETSLINIREIERPEPMKQSQHLNVKRNYPLLEAFKSHRLLWRTVNCSFCWLTNTLVYYGLSLNSVSLVGNKYLNFMVVCFIEIPGFVITYFTMNKVGRRFSQSGSLILSGIACLIYIFVDQDQVTAGLILFLIGKLAITISFTVLYVYTTELFPTNLRHSLLSFCSMFGRIGSIIAPQTPLMAQLYQPLPLILFGTCALLSGILVLQFPETLNTTLPNTIMEAETIGEKNNNNTKQFLIKVKRCCLNIHLTASQSQSHSSNVDRRQYIRYQ